MYNLNVSRQIRALKSSCMINYVTVEVKTDFCLCRDRHSDDRREQVTEPNQNVSAPVQEDFSAVILHVEISYNFLIE